MLDDQAVRAWLGDVEPAWTLLHQDSLAALRLPPSPITGPIRLADDLLPDEIEASAVSRNARLLLLEAGYGAGLKTTATGNLSRSVVAEMFDRFTWPDFDKVDFQRFHKVVNEPDFLPLHFVRHLAESAKLVRRSKGFLRTTADGRKVIGDRHPGALSAVLFHTAFWHLDLNFLGRGLLQGWPQLQIGTVLWSLSVAANDWQSPEKLSRMCAIPSRGVLEIEWDAGAMAMEARILRPLLWFGLVEHQQESIAGSRFAERHLYRKTTFFDRFLSFDVRLEGMDASRH
jgi:hypothetical protein